MPKTWGWGWQVGGWGGGGCTESHLNITNSRQPVESTCFNPFFSPAKSSIKRKKQTDMVEEGEGKSMCVCVCVGGVVVAVSDRPSSLFLLSFFPLSSLFKGCQPKTNHN